MTRVSGWGGGGVLVAMAIGVACSSGESDEERHDPVSESGAGGDSQGGAAAGAAVGGQGDGAAVASGLGQPGTGGSSGNVGGEGGGYWGGGGSGSSGCETPTGGLAVGSVINGEVQLAEVAALDELWGITGALARRTGGWLVGSLGGFWDVADDGSRTFVTSTEEYGTRGLIVADLDGNGTEDLVSLHEDTVTTGEYVTIVPAFVAWERTSDGALARRWQVTPEGGSYLADPPYAVAGLDENGALDLILIELGGPVVYTHDGTFGFDRRPGPQLPLERINSEARGMSVHDANGDGHADVIAVLDSYTSGNPETFAAFFAGDGNGGLAPAVIDVIGVDLRDVRGGEDLTGDGIEDLAGVGYTGDSYGGVFVSAGDGQGGFGDALLVHTFTSQGALPRLQIADLDGTGAHDLLATLGEMWALMSNGAGGFDAQAWHVPIGGTSTATAAPSLEGPSIGMVFDFGCDASCPLGCDGSCFLGSCFACTSSVACTEATCRLGQCTP